MPVNNNGVLTLRSSAQTANTVLAVIPNSNQLMQLDIPIKIRIAGLFEGGLPQDDLELFYTVLFYKPVKDLVPSSPTFGQETSRPLAPSQPTVNFTGVPFIVVFDDLMQPITPRYYFMPQNLLGSSVFDRDIALPGASWDLTVHLTFSVPLPPGGYQGEVLLFSSAGLVGTLLLTLEVQDVDQMFQGDPSLVWYHLV